MDERREYWDEYVDGALFAINTNTSTTTKYSPFFLMYGRNPRLPFEVEKMPDESLSDLQEQLSNQKGIDDHVAKMSKNRDDLFPKVEENISVAQDATVC